MTKNFLLLLFIVPTLLLSQTGKVGVNTISPSESLHVNGTLRIGDLPINGAINAINTTSAGTSSATQNQTFTGIRTVLADANGVLGYSDGIPQVINPTSGSTIKKIIYSATAPDSNKTVTIGGMVFRFFNNSGTWGPQMSLTSAVAKTIYVGFNQQFGPNGFEYKNYTQVFNTTNATTFRDISWESANSIVNYELNIAHIVDSTDGVYYRVTFYISGDSSPTANKSFVIVAEQF
ncbi:hypothetical protein [Cloacibacterium sp. TD35]|uniref:hypothetical protein n=1 Tax=Cloacibacterium sp. TD35 TaxID=2976818 RepID=UPI00237E60D7|nr:hypothetical protein [Cloacibacterium sp. TD35]WDT68310.1 hypothetical protein N7277_01510 [Cloacibacterium sp. TD35]